MRTRQDHRRTRGLSILCYDRDGRVVDEMELDASVLGVSGPYDVFIKIGEVLGDGIVRRLTEASRKGVV